MSEMIGFERNGTQYRMPRRTLESIQRYVQYGVPTGDFLKAVLSNDLFDAFDRADEENWACLGDICRYVYNHIPANAWGSIEKIREWLLHKLEEREKETSENQITNNKKTLLVIIPERGSGDGVYYLIVAETGEGLASHLCSASHFAMGDLYANRPERKKEFGERFGEIEVKYIDETNILLDDLLEKNKKFHEEHKEAKS